MFKLFCAFTALILTIGLGVQAQSEIFRCDFEVDFCGAGNTGSVSDFSWTRLSGPTSSGGTGPPTDHTRGDLSGYYIYAESSSPRIAGDTARLTINNLGSGEKCLSFWYSMFGAQHGELRIKTDVQASQVLWSKAGDQGDQWWRGQIDLNSAVTSLVFEAVRGADWSSDTALDDIVITSLRCGSTAATTTRPDVPTTTRPSQQTQQPPPPPPPPPPSTSQKPPPPPPERQCEVRGRSSHLDPRWLSDFWPLRWPQWFNSTWRLFHEDVVPTYYNQWGLSESYRPMIYDPARGMNDQQQMMMFKDFWMSSRPSSNQVMIRLVGGANEREGRLEILHNNEWGTVCGVDFTAKEAQVVCSALGLYGTAEVVRTFGQGSGRIWLSGLACKPDLPHLAHCCHNNFGEIPSTCSHSNDVGVRCLNDFWIKTRLVGGPSDMEGRVEVYNNGQWGTVCNDGFTWKEAQVVCNSLGFWGQAELLPSGTYLGGGQIWLDGVSCRPDLPHLSHCVHNEFGVHDCTHDKDVAVRCRTFVADYTCQNGTTGSQDWRDPPYITMNQGGMTKKNIDSYYWDKMEQEKMLNDWFNGMPPRDNNPMPGSPGMDQEIDQLWQMLYSIMDQINKKMTQPPPPPPGPRQ